MCGSAAQPVHVLCDASGRDDYLDFPFLHTTLSFLHLKLCCPELFDQALWQRLVDCELHAALRDHVALEVIGKQRKHLAAVWRLVDVVLERRDAHEAPAILEKCRHAIFDGLLCVRHDLENAATHLFESRTLWLFYPIEKLIDFGFRHRRSFG